MLTQKQTYVLILAIVGLLVAASALMLYVISPNFVASDGVNATIINKLASTNPQYKNFNLDELPHRSLPEGWSNEEDERVKAVYRKILKNCRTSVPALIANSEDRAFSTYEQWADYEPQSVGRMCRKILGAHFDFVGPMYKFRMVGDRSQSGETFFFSKSKKELEEWWHKNDFKTDDEIRKEIKSWHVRRENMMGFASEDEKKHLLDMIEQNYKTRSEKNSVRQDY